MLRETDERDWLATRKVARVWQISSDAVFMWMCQRRKWNVQSNCIYIVDSNYNVLNILRVLRRTPALGRFIRNIDFRGDPTLSGACVAALRNFVNLEELSARTSAILRQLAAQHRLSPFSFSSLRTAFIGFYLDSLAAATGSDDSVLHFIGSHSSLRELALTVDSISRVADSWLQVQLAKLFSNLTLLKRLDIRTSLGTYLPLARMLPVGLESLLCDTSSSATQVDFLEALRDVRVLPALVSLPSIWGDPGDWRVQTQWSGLLETWASRPALRNAEEDLRRLRRLAGVA